MQAQALHDAIRWWRRLFGSVGRRVCRRKHVLFVQHELSRRISMHVGAITADRAGLVLTYEYSNRRVVVGVLDVVGYMLDKSK
jgi:hypothetical protein